VEKNYLNLAEHCILHEEGHATHPLAGSSFLSQESYPVTIQWVLGSQQLEVMVDRIPRTYYHHDPAGIARAMGQLPNLSPRMLTNTSLLRVQTASNSFRTFSLSVEPLSGCVVV
jgi:hypothetical protein